MSSSSSDSDSDDFEPVRKIKINIRPKEDVVRRGAADVSEIRASVEAWRPLGPPPHPSLSRRQSSLSSVSSMSFGMGSVYGSSSGTTTSVNATNLIAHQASSNTGMLSSPSCSSLVNELNNRASFTNLLGIASRTVSPSTPTGQTDVVPVAVAIQESIELVVRANIEPHINSEPEFSTRAMGNIKVAFSNTLARSFCKGKSYPTLKFKLHPTNKITRYFLSRLIKETESKLEPAISTINNKSIVNGEKGKQSTNAIDLLDLDITPQPIQANFKVIEFDMKELNDHLKKSYEQTPMSKYYNVDVLRYQISPITSIEESPLQVCAYWKLESRCIKLRIYFKQSNRSGMNIDRLRDISFTVDLNSFLSEGIDVDDRTMSSNIHSSTKFIDHAAVNSSSAKLVESPKLPLLAARAQTATSKIHIAAPNLPARIAPPPIPAARSSIGISRKPTKKSDDFGSAFEISDIATSSTFDALPEQNFVVMGADLSSESDNQSENNLKNSNHTLSSKAHILSEPPAQWDKITKQLVWKFDHMMQSRFASGGSLLAKLDFTNYPGILSTDFLTKAKPAPIDVKFIIPESSLSNVSIDIESTGYKLSLLKREIRSGRYKSEAYVV